MEKYIQKSVVLAEIEKLSAYLDGFHEQRIIEKILSIIDTLEVKEVQEESVSEELEEAAKERVDAEDYGYVDEDGMPLYDSGYLEYMFKEGAKWQLAKIKSITLDDLGKFINEISKQFPEVSFAKVCKIATRTAKWLLDVELPKLEED